MYPNRHATPIPDSNHGHHATGTILNVRARIEADDSSVWLLTNYGWVAEKGIGNSNNRHFVDVYFDSPPIAVKVLRTSFVEAPTPNGWFEKRKVSELPTIYFCLFVLKAFFKILISHFSFSRVCLR